MISKIFIFILFGTMMGYSSIQLERFSINTYSNKEHIRHNSQNLGEDESSASNESLYVVKVGFRQYANPNISLYSTLSLENRMTIMDSVDLEMIKGPLVYPSPLQLKSGNGILYYELNKADAVTIKVYNMFGYQILNRNCSIGSEGGKHGINKFKIDIRTFNSYDVPASVYFVFVFDSQRNMIGKTTFAIVP